MNNAFLPCVLLWGINQKFYFNYSFSLLSPSFIFNIIFTVTFSPQHFFFFLYCIQHCFICRPSDSTLSEDAVIEPRTVATTAMTVRRSNHSAKSHPLLVDLQYFSTCFLSCLFSCLSPLPHLNLILPLPFFPLNHFPAFPSSVSLPCLSFLWIISLPFFPLPHFPAFLSSASLPCLSSHFSYLPAFLPSSWLSCLPFPYSSFCLTFPWLPYRAFLTLAFRSRPSTIPFFPLPFISFVFYPTALLSSVFPLSFLCRSSPAFLLSIFPLTLRCRSPVEEFTML